MEPMRWIGGLLPLAAVAFLAAGPAAHPALLRAVDPPGQPPPCAGGGAAWGVRASGGTGWTAAGRPGLARRAAAERGDGGRTGAAAGPAAGVVRDRPVRRPVLVGSDDGESRACRSWTAARVRDAISDEEAIVRSALLAPDGTAIVEHRIDRVTRADLGVWRRPLDGGRDTRIRRASLRGSYGRTFTTELRWAPDGRLGVTSAGSSPAGRGWWKRPGRTSTVGPTGPVSAWLATAAWSVSRLPGFPCAILTAVDGGGSGCSCRSAGRAALAGRRLVFEARAVSPRSTS